MGSWIKTYVFKPDSVHALAPKNKASIARKLPYGYMVMNATIEHVMMYVSVSVLVGKAARWRTG